MSSLIDELIDGAVTSKPPPGGGTDQLMLVLVRTGSRIPTANQYQRATWQQNQRTTRLWRQAAEAAFREYKRHGPTAIDELSGAALSITIMPVQKRGKPQDTGACAPAAKAIIDALTPGGYGIGLIPDDSPQWVPEIIYSAPIVDARADDGIFVLIMPYGPLGREASRLLRSAVDTMRS